MNNWLGTWHFFRRECRRFLKVWTQTIGAPLSSSLLYFAIFGGALGSRIGVTDGVSYLHFLVPGLVAMNMAQHAYQNSSSSLIQMKYLNMLPADLLALPITPLQVALAFTLSAVVRGILVGAVVLGAASVFVDFTILHPILFVVSAFLLTANFGLLGLLTGLWGKTFDDVSMVGNFMLTPLIYLGGVFFSISFLPTAWQPVAKLNPVYYLVDLFRHSMIGTTPYPTQTSMIAALMVLILLFSVATFSLSKGWRIKS